MFWPKAVWSKYVDSLEDLKEEEHSEEAVECLNELINHALGHVPACLEYMAKLKDPKVFAFCAIPQIMAIGTLSLWWVSLSYRSPIQDLPWIEAVIASACSCPSRSYNNIKVFRGVVKMRRGQAAVIVTATRNMGDVYRAFASFAMDIQEKCQGLSAAKV